MRVNLETVRNNTQLEQIRAMHVFLEAATDVKG